MRLGIIGFGEAGYYLSKDFTRDNLSVYAYDICLYEGNAKSNLVRARARENQVILVNDWQELTKKADMFFCLTSAASALSVAKEIAPLLQKGQIYIDMNSTSPHIKEEIGKIFEQSKADFVEAAVMSSVPTKRTQVPIWLCGKRSAETALQLNSIGMNVKAFSEELGQASAVKMLKSILAKGIIAVVTETIFCTEKYKVTDIVLKEEKEFLDELGFFEYCNHDITQAVTHCERFYHEMEEVFATVQAIGENGIMTHAAAQKFKWLTEEGYNKHFLTRPESYHDIITIKNELKNRKEGNL